MKRVLQVFGRLGRGGLESFVVNLYKALDRNEVQFDFLLNVPNGDYEDEVKSLGANIYYIPSRANGVKAYRDALNGFFRENADKYAAVHLHASSLSSIEPLLYAKEYGIKIRIIHSHSSSVKKNLKARSIHYLLHAIYRLRIGHIATHYFGCSDKALDWMFSWSGVRYKAMMINNGIDMSLFRYDLKTRFEIRSELGFKNEFVIGHVGSFIHVKNHKFLVDIFAKLYRQIPDTRLLLVGDGELRNEIEDDIKANGIQNAVTLTGIRPDVNKLLQGMDLIIMPSFFEGLPVSLVEAQAAGLPVLASDTISHDAAITPNMTFLSLKDKPAVWINRINSIMEEFRRQDTTEYIEKAGFDIRQTASYISKIYIK